MSDGPIFLAAHSLGASQINLYAHSRLVRGLRLDGVYSLASPNPGNHVIPNRFEAERVANGLIGRSLKNLRDLVCDVPPDIERCNEEYVQGWPFIEINEPPPPFDPWFLFKDHHIELYQAGAHKLPLIGAAIEIGDAADLVARLYQTAEGWDWIDTTDGLYWAMKKFPNGAKLLIRRGSVTEIDWLKQDLNALQVDWYDARVSRGFLQGVAPLEATLDTVLAA